MGIIALDNVNLEIEKEELASLIGHVIEDRRLLPHLTVKENLRMGAYLKEA